jgi:LacI family transcriptional regulator
MLAAEVEAIFSADVSRSSGDERTGTELDEKLMNNLNSTHSGSYEDMKAVLDHRGFEPPVAFFACNDMVAIGAVRALREYHLRVPEDVSIVGFDDLPPLPSCLLH